MRSIIFLFLFVTMFSYSQDKDAPRTIEQHIDYVYTISNTYEQYKVIRKTRFENLKKEIIDSLQHYRSQIHTKNKLVQKQQDSLATAQKVINDLSMDLKLSLDIRNEINFLGMSIRKSTYQLFVWSLILGLLFLLGYYIYKFKNSFVITRNAQRELAELEEEFAAHKKKALSKEQKLRRKLQDEINKQRGV